MNINYNKSYWRVDAEYQTLKHVVNVSDQAPVGVWITALGQPYIYFENEDDAKEVFKVTIQNEIKRLQSLIEGL